MKQRNTILELAKKGLSASQIKQHLDEQFGKEAYSLKTIYKWKNSLLFESSSDEEKVMPGPKVDEQLLIKIQQVFEEQQYASIREIADNLNESISTVWRYVTHTTHTQKSKN